MDFIDFSEFIAKVDELNRRGEEFVICTVVESIGSSPQRPGSKMVVASDGNTYGTVGGGIVESSTIEKAEEMLKKRLSPTIIGFELNEKGEGLCGGSMKIYLEGIYKKLKLLIFGAGHVSEAVCDIFKRLNYQITVFDDREERLNLHPFSHCNRICAEYSRLEEYIICDEETDVLIMTPSHKYDFEVVKRLLKMPFRSLGLLGSKRKRVELIEYLRSEGFKEDAITKVRIPVGLEIGSHTPYEIAISIAAEMIKMKRETG
ncbi:MAG: XdhC family protein [Myxococcota bacterium]